MSRFQDFKALSETIMLFKPETLEPFEELPETEPNEGRIRRI